MIPQPLAWCPSIYSLLSSMLLLDPKWDPKSPLLSIFLPTFCIVKLKIWGSRSPLRSTSPHHSNLTALCSFFGSLLSCHGGLDLLWRQQAHSCPWVFVVAVVFICIYPYISQWLTSSLSSDPCSKIFLSGATSGLPFKIEILLQPPALLPFLFHFFLIVPMAV